MHLADGQPDEVVPHGYVLGGLDQHVPVPLVQEPGTLLGLQHVDQDPGPPPVGEVLQVRDRRALVHPGVVTPGGLDGG